MLQSPTLTLFALVSALTILASVSRYRARMAKLSAIPTVGHSGFLSSYISAYKFLKNATAIVQEGYNRYPKSAFKIPLLDRWLVVISGEEMLEDLRKASDDELSLRLAFRETLHTDIILGGNLAEASYHLDVIRTSLTRNIGSKASEVHDEIVAAFNDEIPLTNEWVKTDTLNSVLRIVCRASNRLFVGLPLCRNEEWKALNIQFTKSFFNAAQTINLFPKFLQPIVGWYLNPRKAAFVVASKHLRPVILDRLEKMTYSEDDDWDAPDDLLTWLIKAADVRKDGEVDPDDLIVRVLTINMAAIHTTSMVSYERLMDTCDVIKVAKKAFTHALFNLAARPELIQPLREEAEALIQEEGWTKAAMGKMRMMDSFLKESQRFSSSFAVQLSRIPLHDFTFSNGVVVPAGTLVTTCPQATHFDENNYPSASEFDALRSYRRREKETEGYKHQMVTPEANYLSFGTGKHACPGRFFAVNELKFLMSHTLLHYDIRFDEEEEKPEPNRFGGRINLNAKTKIMFRKRLS